MKLTKSLLYVTIILLTIAGYFTFANVKNNASDEVVQTSFEDKESTSEYDPKPRIELFTEEQAYQEAGVGQCSDGYLPDDENLEAIKIESEDESMETHARSTFKYAVVRTIRSEADRTERFQTYVNAAMELVRESRFEERYWNRRIRELRLAGLHRTNFHWFNIDRGTGENFYPHAPNDANLGAMDFFIFNFGYGLHGTSLVVDPRLGWAYFNSHGSRALPHNSMFYAELDEGDVERLIEVLDEIGLRDWPHYPVWPEDIEITRQMRSNSWQMVILFSDNPDPEPFPVFELEPLSSSIFPLRLLDDNSRYEQMRRRGPVFFYGHPEAIPREQFDQLMEFVASFGAEIRERHNEFFRAVDEEVERRRRAR